MSSSWAGGCPCKDCNFKTKNSYPLVNYIQNCNYERRIYISKETEKRAEELLPLYWFCNKAKRCLNEGCDFRSTVAWDILTHMQKCRDQLPLDDTLFNELCQSYPRWEQWEKASNFKAIVSKARGKKLSSW